MASVRLQIYIAHSLICIPPNGALQADTLKDMQMFIKEGGRLDCPENCPPEVYEIMKTCWYERPEERPTFKELLEELKALPPSYERPEDRPTFKELLEELKPLPPSDAHVCHLPLISMFE